MTTPASAGDSTKAELPASRARRRGSSRRAVLLIGAAGALIGAAATVALLAFYMPRHAAVARSEPRTEAPTASARPAPSPSAKPALAVGGLPVSGHAPLADNAADSAAGDPDGADTPSADGSDEDDRVPPPEPATAPRIKEPQVRTLADVRALIRKGQKDGALSGLYRLRRAHPAPSAARQAQIATWIGHLYFDRRWWTDALREYRFAIKMDPHARYDGSIISNSVRALGERLTYWRARRLLCDYVGRPAVGMLKHTVKVGPTAVLRRRAQSVLSSIEAHGGRPRASR